MAARRAGARWVSKALAGLPGPEPSPEFSPVFLLGSGRSGTTIVGQMLGAHRSVLYLNEPRYLWRVIDPRTDVWDERAGNGQLSMDQADVDCAIERRARRGFGRALTISRRAILVEKLPINTFRIGYVQALFPTARFVLLRRHGLEVAHSIAATRTWYARASVDRWNSISELAVSAGVEETFLRSCSTDLEKGLIEWTLAMERLDRLAASLHQSDPSALLGELDFGTVLKSPVEALRQVLDIAIGPGAGDASAWHSKVERMVDAPTNDFRSSGWPEHVHPLTKEALERRGYTMS